MRTFLGLVAGFLFLAFVPASRAEESVRILTPRPEVSLAMLLIKPEGPVAASLIMFVGAGGYLGLAPDWPTGKRGANFLFRTADDFVKEGFAVAVLDADSDHSGGLWNARTGRNHAEDVRAAIGALRAAIGAPVWLVGTSMGTVSVANAGARLQEGGADGLVLTSSVTVPTKRSAESVLSVDLKAITVPVLVVRHDQDGCDASPPWNAPRILNRLEHSPRKELIGFSGGSPPQSGPCEPFAQHGYLGIEQRVVGAIAAWIRGQ